MNTRNTAINGGTVQCVFRMSIYACLYHRSTVCALYVVKGETKLKHAKVCCLKKASSQRRTAFPSSWPSATKQTRLSEHETVFHF